MITFGLCYAIGSFIVLSRLCLDNPASFVPFVHLMLFKHILTYWHFEVWELWQFQLAFSAQSSVQLTVYLQIPHFYHTTIGR